MADNLQWMTVLAFPGVDHSLADHLLQPPQSGPAVMRRLLSVDPFTERGQFNPAPGYSLFDAASATQGLHGHLSGQSLELYRVQAGALYKRVGSSWEQVVSSKLPMHTTKRVRFASGFNAMFMVDGYSRPKVLGWNYVLGDPQVEWDTQEKVCDIKYTYGQKSEPDSSDDDFAANLVCFHNDRLVLVKGVEARMSAPAGTGGPTCFYSTETDLVQQAWWLVEEGDGLNVTWAGSYENQMLVMGKPFSLHGYMGDDPASSFSRMKLDEGRGIYAADSPAFGGQRLWFCSYEGPCYLDIKQGVKFVGEPIAAIWETMNDQQRASVVGWWQNQRYYVLLPLTYTSPPQTLPTESRVLLSFDPVTKRWAEGHGVHGTAALIRQSGGGQYLLAATSAGIYRNLNGSTLAGPQPVQELVTPWITLGEPWRDKWLRMLKLELVQSAAVVELAYATDFNPTWTVEQLQGNLPATMWGAFTWRHLSHPEASYWNAGGKYTIELPKTVHCKTFRLRIRGEGLRLRALGVGFMYEGT